MATEQPKPDKDEPQSPYLDEYGNYDGPDGWSEVYTFGWRVGETLRGSPRCSECGWSHGDHRAADDACPLIPYEAAFPNG